MSFNAGATHHVIMSCAGIPDTAWGNLPLSIAVVIILSLTPGFGLAAFSSGASGTKQSHEGIHSTRSAFSSKPDSPERLGEREGLKPRFRRQSEPPLTEEQREAWRGKVGSKVVEFAWEKLCGSLIQQWVRNIIHT